MTEIKYYPVIDCDTEGTEKVAMIPAPNSTAVQAQSEMWLEEMLPHYFRLCTQTAIVLQITSISAALAAVRR